MIDPHHPDILERARRSDEKTVSVLINGEDRNYTSRSLNEWVSGHDLSGEDKIALQSAFYWDDLELLARLMRQMETAAEIRKRGIR